jgi:hypothetical protein
MRRIIHIVSIVGILVTAALIFIDPGLATVSAFIGALLAFLTTFEKKPEDLSDSPPNQEMSANARRVLSDIEASDESDPKGVSLMMVQNVLGLYRPFIWSHGTTSGNDGYDTTGVISAIDELVDLGFLVSHYEGDSLRQWRRTTKQPS